MKNKIKIQDRRIGDGEPCFIIAEAGVNHNGELDKAKLLIDIAKNANVDAVKFQTWKTEELLTENVIQAKYQTKNTGVEESQFEMLKKLELSYNEFEILKNYAENKGLIFLSTPDEEKSAEFLNNLGVQLFKIGSGEVTNIPFLKKIASMNKPIILSTGMATLIEIRRAYEEIVGMGNNKIILLHCTSEYPTDLDDVNMNSMLTLRKNFGIDIGYSDHTIGILASITAVAMGASVIEKHFTYDKSAKGPDHKCSLSPTELKELVEEIRKIEKIMGSWEKKPTNIELENAKIVRKSVVAKNFIEKGSILEENMVSMKRANGFIVPSRLNEFIGRKFNKDILKDQALKPEDFHDS
ncbi:N-acetylneuraminate synthase [Candidatus Lokiarchaeum ossiferum]|uniref:N-acetylneuraminate synthase n=1 Tax=Candidatus Lokiarchaeum ossiferum TaxID=2951803 RepID=UPI00352C93B8